jgi:hypothetical protein
MTNEERAREAYRIAGEADARPAVADMTTEQALECARSWRDGEATPHRTEVALLVLAAKVIEMREGESDFASTWQQHRDNALVPAEVRRAADALVERRSS